jgi:hypothetical protein
MSPSDPQKSIPQPTAQVKVSHDLKRELAIFAKVAGRTQGQLLADAWAEYRANHRAELLDGLRWAESTLADPAAAAVHASGMPTETLDEISQAFADPTPDPSPSVEPADIPRRAAT